MPSTPSTDAGPSVIPSYANEVEVGGNAEDATSGLSESKCDHMPKKVEVPDAVASLPPLDKGFDAYAYLVSAWILDVLVWSFPFSYGVFLNYYTTVLFAPDDPQLHLLPIVGTLSCGILYIASLVVLPLILNYPGQKRGISFIGLLLCVLGFIGAGFSTRPVHLVVTQGIVYPLGGNLLYFPVFTYLMEWFSAKRGLANGILFSGACVGGIAVPFVTQVLLRRYGHKTTFFIFAAIFGGFSLPAFAFAKPRLPVAQKSATAAVDRSFIKSQVFWVFFIANIVQGFANYLPNVYLPSFANDLGLSTTSGTLALALLNGTSVLGLIFIGGMSDRLDLRVPISVSTIGSGLAILLVWGFTAKLAPLLFFACLHGFFSSGFSALWPRFIGVISAEDQQVQSILMCLFLSSRGLGNVLSGPLSTGLMRHSPFYGNNKYGYGVEGYGSLILFAGVCMLASAAAITYPYFTGKTIEMGLLLSKVSSFTKRGSHRRFEPNP